MKKIFTLLTFSMLLSACSVTTPQKIAPELQQSYWQQHLHQVEKIEQYRIRGSLAYLSDQQKSFAHFFWQQHSAQNYSLRINTPFGSTLLDIESHENYVKLTDQRGKVYFGNNTQALIHELTNMDIPLSLLQSWILGLPGNSQAIELNDRALLKTASQETNHSLCSVTISEYTSDIQPALPQKLELNCGKEIIKLRIDKWSL